MRQFTPVLTQTQAPLPTFQSSKHSFASNAFSAANFSTVSPNSTAGSISTEESDESEESSGKGKGMSKDEDAEDGPRSEEKVYDPGIDDKDKAYEFANETEEKSTPEPEPEKPPKSNEAQQETAKIKESMGWWKSFKSTVGRLAPEPSIGGYSSSGEVQRLEEENIRLRQVGANLQDDLVRLWTRTDKEKKDIEKFACEKFAKELLSVQDNFDLAMKNLTPEMKASVERKEVLSVLEGVELTQKSLLKAFEKFDIKKIETVGQANFSCHEVMFTLRMEDKPENEIVEVLRDGYWIGDRVLRAAQVGVVKNT
jgi:molecular chaperone GrpE